MQMNGHSEMFPLAWWSRLAGVTIIAKLFAAFWGAHAAFGGQPATRPAFEVGRIEAADITESSGIVASRKYPGVFWTHTDSGGKPVLCAMSREGKTISEITVAAKNVDWEDLAIDDEGHLFISDTGNNGSRRKEVFVYRVDEPDPHAKPAGDLKVTATYRLRYAAQPFDGESLFIWKGKGYLISKVFPGLSPVLYSFKLEGSSQPLTLQREATLPIRSSVTGADISADGSELAVMTVTGPYLFKIDGDPLKAATATPRHVSHFNLNMEGVCFVAEGVLATTEGRQVLLFRREDFAGN